MGSHSSWKFAMQGLVAFTYDEQTASKLDERDRQLGLHGEGVLNGFLEVKAISLDQVLLIYLYSWCLFSCNTQILDDSLNWNLMTFSCSIVLIVVHNLVTASFHCHTIGKKIRHSSQLLFTHSFFSMCNRILLDLSLKQHTLCVFQSCSVGSDWAPPITNQRC